MLWYELGIEKDFTHTRVVPVIPCGIWTLNLASTLLWFSLELSMMTYLCFIYSRVLFYFDVPHAVDVAILWTRFFIFAFR